MDDGSVRNGFWQNLEQVHAASRASGVPFCSIVLSVGHFNYREPTRADLRFEVYSALAYGARGIAYFTYFAPPTGNYRGAPMDQFGNPTPAWHNMQNVNLQVQKLAPMLLQLTCNDTHHFTNIPEGAHGPRPTSLVTACDGGDFVCGEFTHHDRSRYVLLTNKDVVKSAACHPHYIRTAATGAEGFAVFRCVGGFCRRECLGAAGAGRVVEAYLLAVAERERGTCWQFKGQTLSSKHQNSNSRGSPKLQAPELLYGSLMIGDGRANGKTRRAANEEVDYQLPK